VQQKLRRARQTARSTPDHPDDRGLDQVVKAEAGPETVDRAVSCRSCGEALLGRERALFRVSTLDFALQLDLE
jgi:hypothetical protein